MANELFGVVGTSGLTVKAVLWDASGRVWNGSAYETFLSANWATYLNATTEFGTVGVYGGSVPSGALDDWTIATFHEGTSIGVPYATQQNPARVVNANVASVNSVAVTGVGTETDPWGP